MIIDPELLKALRQQKKLSQQRLAERARRFGPDAHPISKRQIQRLENGTDKKKVRERTALKLAEALGVDPRVLSGEHPMPEPDTAIHRPEGERKQINAWATPEARLAYDLIAKRYGVNVTTIINMAPLFFVLLAEGSLKWRREKLQQLDEAINEMHNLGKDAGHLAYSHCVWCAEEAMPEEEKSIEELDLFGKHISDEAFEFGFDPSKQNPFADYLRLLVRELDLPGVVELDPDGDKELDYGAVADFPQYQVCKDELRRVIGIDGGWAEYALKHGHARLNEIPDELRDEDATDERAKWLEERVPEDDKILFSSIAIDVSELLDEGAKK